MNPLTAILVSTIRARGPMTVADYMELALYHPEHGYYSTAGRRSGRDGDFFTSVDVGPLFGKLLARQIAEMWAVLRGQGASEFHLVEAGASDGRLARDMLDGIAESAPELYGHLRVTLVERSARARERHVHVLGPHFTNIPIRSASSLPSRVTGAIIANELLDAMPVHVLETTTAGLCEVHIGEESGRLCEVLRPLSNERVRTFLDASGAAVPPGVRIEAGVAAIDWMQHAAQAIERGFLLLMDYGQEQAELYSARHPAGTLVTYGRHLADAMGWLDAPGTRDITAHVNLTAVRSAASSAGLCPLGLVDQTYFLTSLGLVELLNAGRDMALMRQRLAARTLIQPGGLGSTMKAMAFGKDVGAPVLRGFAKGRVT